MLWAPRNRAGRPLCRRLGWAWRPIVIVHDGDWIGGQFTEQALACVDENKGVGKVGWGVDWHPMKRSFHRSGLFKELMDRIEAHNQSTYGSRMPGRPYHGPSTCRPREAEAIFRQMLQPHLDAGQVRLITSRYPVRADVERAAGRPLLRGLWFAGVDGNVRRTCTSEPASRLTLRTGARRFKLPVRSSSAGRTPGRAMESRAPRTTCPAILPTR